ncbi:transporter [Herbaspirillum sp. DW155]|uniref:DUF6662 family protein n=1 Tax=Herbaspirillum sp. DW155 TaxID=3095609 RepID=UPI00309277EC|nr:transporter [Herbaspirillum sp. DW155]
MTLSKPIKLLAGLLAGAALLPAHAGEGAFGWLYTLDIQPKGKLEFEQKIDVTHNQSAGSYNWTQYRSALEYGLTNDLQVAGYINAYSINANKNYINPEACNDSVPCTAGFGVPASVSGSTDSFRQRGIDGFSLEAIYRITNPLTSPVGVGVYVEPTYGKLENELETRLILQSNFLDDRLVFAINVLSELEREKYADGVIHNSMLDLLYGMSYRVAPRWTIGLEGRLHTDYDGNFYQSHSQTANFFGPTLHYAEKDWWVTAAWRHQLNGRCYNDGTADCSNGHVSDNHGRDEVMIKFGIPLN